MVLPDYLTQDDHGSIRLAGHRIGLAHLLHYYNEGYSPEMLWNEYSSLSLALIHKVIAFYLEHQAAVDEYVVQGKEEMDRQRAQPQSGPSVKELRQRLGTVRKAQGA